MNPRILKPFFKDLKNSINFFIKQVDYKNIKTPIDHMCISKFCSRNNFNEILKDNTLVFKKLKNSNIIYIFSINYYDEKINRDILKYYIGVNKNNNKEELFQNIFSNELKIKDIIKLKGKNVSIDYVNNLKNRFDCVNSNLIFLPKLYLIDKKYISDFADICDFISSNDFLCLEYNILDFDENNFNLDRFKNLFFIIKIILIPVLLLLLLNNTVYCIPPKIYSSLLEYQMHSLGNNNHYFMQNEIKFDNFVSLIKNYYFNRFDLKLRLLIPNYENHFILDLPRYHSLRHKHIEIYCDNFKTSIEMSSVLTHKPFGTSKFLLLSKIDLNGVHIDQFISESSYFTNKGFLIEKAMSFEDEKYISLNCDKFLESRIKYVETLHESLKTNFKYFLKK